MTILVAGSTGTIGKLVVQNLVGAGAAVRALVRDPSKPAALPAGVPLVQGDLLDVASMRKALQGIDTLFLLNAVVADELTQALATLDLARELGLTRFVYFSVFNGVQFAEVPHFASKYTVERAIDQFDIPATVLRPAYFMQNDLGLKDAILSGTYPMPIGSVGVAMADARDIAEVAAHELLRRDQAPAPLPRCVIEVVGPDTLTGESIAAIWSDVLRREVRYGGDNLDAFEQQMSQRAPSWQARDMKIMLRAFHRSGMVPQAGTRAILEGHLGHPLRSYRDFAQDAAARWQAS